MKNIYIICILNKNSDDNKIVKKSHLRYERSQVRIVRIRQIRSFGLWIFHMKHLLACLASRIDMYAVTANGMTLS